MIVELELWHAVEVMRFARPTDVAAWMPTKFDKTPSAWAIERFEAPGVKQALLGPDGQPLAIGGFTLTFPGNWTAWFIAKDGWQRYAKTVIKFTRGTMARMFDEDVALRIQAFVHSSDGRAMRFAERLGFEHECTNERMASGEDYEQYRRFS